MNQKKLPYLFPCKPNTLNPNSSYFLELDKDMGWIAEVKKNGWRCLVYSNGTIDLWTRDKTLIKKPLLQLRKILPKVIPKGMVVDGEILDHRSNVSPGRLYLFDVLFYKFKMVTHLPLTERRKIIEKHVVVVPGIVDIAHQVMIGKRNLFLSLEANEDEGIVLKKLNSPYNTSLIGCQQNPFWLKIRR